MSVRDFIASHIACAEKGILFKAAIKLSAAVLTAVTATFILLIKSTTVVSSPFTVLINAATLGSLLLSSNPCSKLLNPAITVVCSGGFRTAATSSVRVFIKPGNEVLKPFTEL